MYVGQVQVQFFFPENRYTRRSDLSWTSLPGELILLIVKDPAKIKTSGPRNLSEFAFGICGVSKQFVLTFESL